MFAANTDEGIIVDQVRTAECKMGISMRIGTSVRVNSG